MISYGNGTSSSSIPLLKHCLAVDSMQKHIIAHAVRGQHQQNMQQQQK